MSNNIVTIAEPLATKICTDFLEGKKIEKKDDLIFELKNVLHEFSIDDVDFLNLRHLVEALCILKGIDYSKEYADTGLAKLFNFKQTEFKKIDDELFVQDFDKQSVHKQIIAVLEKICNKLCNEKYKFTLRYEIIRGGGYRYFIEKNKEDVYICFYPNLYEGEIYIRRFMSIKPDLRHGAPESVKAGRKFVTQHKYAHKIPYFDGFFLNEIERVIQILEEYGN